MLDACNLSAKVTANIVVYLSVRSPELIKTTTADKEWIDELIDVKNAISTRTKCTFPTCDCHMYL